MIGRAARWLVVPVSLATAGAGQAQVRGHLFIVGGAVSPTRWSPGTCHWEGPGRAHVVVVPMASGDARETGEEKAGQLRAFGAATEVLLLTRAEAEDRASASRLEGVTGFWFTGGDQVLLARVLQDTPVLRAMQRRYGAGAVVGGTSARAAVMGDFCSPAIGAARTAWATTATIPGPGRRRF